MRFFYAVYAIGILVTFSIIAPLPAASAGGNIIADTMIKPFDVPSAPHAPITIEGDAAFIPANGVTGGSGTSSDPYIIQGWDISTSGAICMKIRNTTKPFVVRDCFLHEGTKTGIGIHILNVRDAKFINVSMAMNLYGAVVEKSENLTFHQNSIINNDAIGYYCTYLNHSTFSFNNISTHMKSGLYMTGCQMNHVHHNMFMNNGFAAGVKQAIDDEGLNIWNASDIGNYWNDLTGPDFDHNGIVDFSYNLSGTSNAKDMLPKAAPVAPEMSIMPALLACTLMTLVLVPLTARRKN